MDALARCADVLNQLERAAAADVEAARNAGEERNLMLAQLRKSLASRGGMLEAVVRMTPERYESFRANLSERVAKFRAARDYDRMEQAEVQLSMCDHVRSWIGDNHE